MLTALVAGIRAFWASLVSKNDFGVEKAMYFLYAYLRSAKKISFFAPYPGIERNRKFRVNGRVWWRITLAQDLGTYIVHQDGRVEEDRQVMAYTRAK